jgi:murein L,D-transpeptidase YafK
MIKKLSIMSAAMLLVAGCASQIDPRRGHAPQPASLVTASQNVGATSTSPVLLRIFKESRELELWRKTSNGHYALVKTYAICAYSGSLGPKHKAGDRQAPEGFYSIGPAQLNYQSIRFVSLNTGFPNAYDRAHGASGSALMIHGGCDSAGCYAIKDAPAQEVFTAVRDALKAGQHNVQLHIFPFRMTDWAMSAHQTDKNISFWREIKIGYDKFNLTHKEISVSIVNKQYKIN